MILKEHHIRYGLSTQEDDHVIALCHRGTVIARFPTAGIMSAKSIQNEADEYINKIVNPGVYRGR